MGSRVELFAAIYAGTPGSKNCRSGSLHAGTVCTGAPGEEAEVDFSEVWVVLGGVKTKCYMSVLWLSPLRVDRAGPGPCRGRLHVGARGVLGGVPQSQR